jgi:hypothetical protein
VIRQHKIYIKIKIIATCFGYNQLAINMHKYKNVGKVFFFPMARQPLRGPRPSHFSRFRDHTLRHTKFGRTPLDE